MFAADGPVSTCDADCPKGNSGIGIDIGEVKLNKDMLVGTELALLIGVLTGPSGDVSS